MTPQLVASPIYQNNLINLENLFWIIKLDYLWSQATAETWLELARERVRSMGTRWGSVRTLYIAIKRRERGWWLESKTVFDSHWLMWLWPMACQGRFSAKRLQVLQCSKHYLVNTMQNCQMVYSLLDLWVALGGIAIGLFGIDMPRVQLRSLNVWKC